ncbi:unnamed protein product [Protopolystoma xenopodis]|uniref:Uncharacterized protein n=1 Tax=Protopolystoma xenopodis TaxID=117903 RepID=A0A3S5CKJ8_9PLAT|nr:unnamed protein product [Protopolystoma xenopodis]
MHHMPASGSALGKFRGSSHLRPLEPHADSVISSADTISSWIVRRAYLRAAAQMIATFSHTTPVHFCICDGTNKKYRTQCPRQSLSATVSSTSASTRRQLLLRTYLHINALSLCSILFIGVSTLAKLFWSLRSSTFLPQYPPVLVTMYAYNKSFKET